MADIVKKVAITGPESTGKSMLTHQLADYFKTSCVDEFAREYIASLQRPYCEDDILLIAQKQLSNEQQSLSTANSILFSDTELIVTKIWSEVKYNRCHPWILNNIPLNSYDLYLLCYIDLPWEEDPQREHPGMRHELFELYYQELKKRNLLFAIIKGLGDERLKNALNALHKHGII